MTSSGLAARRRTSHWLKLAAMIVGWGVVAILFPAALTTEDDLRQQR